MARTADQLTASEEVMISELDSITNERYVYKNSSGAYTWVELTWLSWYTVTNNTTDRTLDCDSTTLDELADVVWTLIDDIEILGGAENAVLYTQWTNTISQTSANASYDIWWTHQIWQGFTTTSDTELSSITVRNIFWYTDTLTCTVYARDGSWFPTGGALWSKSATSIYETTFTFDSPINLSASTQYVFVIESDATYWTNSISLESTNVYAWWTRIYSSDSGSSWTDWWDDLYFILIFNESISPGDIPQFITTDWREIGGSGVQYTELATSDWTTWWTWTAWSWKQYVELTIDWTTYKVLHDGTI